MSVVVSIITLSEMKSIRVPSANARSNIVLAEQHAKYEISNNSLYKRYKHPSRTQVVTMIVVPCPVATNTLQAI